MTYTTTAAESLAAELETAKETRAAEVAALETSIAIYQESISTLTAELEALTDIDDRNSKRAEIDAAITALKAAEADLLALKYTPLIEDTSEGLALLAAEVESNYSGAHDEIMEHVGAIIEIQTAAGTVFIDAAELAQAYDPYPSAAGTGLHNTAAKADGLLKRWAAMADAINDRVNYN